jgi:hypothetical protein
MAQLPNSGLETHPSGVPSLNAIVNGNWNILDSWVNPAAGLTAAQAGATVTASNTIFTSENVGDKIRFASGTECTITATAGTVASPSSVCTVTPSRTVASAAFNMYAPTTQSPKSALARALTKKTKTADITAGTTLIWNSSKGIYEPGGTEGAPLLYMNIRSSGTNAELNNSSALGQIHGRNTNATKILANTIVANSQIEFELVGKFARAAGDIHFQISIGSIVFSGTASFTPPSAGFLRIAGTLRFTGTTNTMAINGLPLAQVFQNGSNTVLSDRFTQVGSATIDMTADQEFKIEAQWSTANVGNTLNVETFSLKRLTLAN